ncbi:Y-box-binding protein 1-like [Phyllostomus discolor]|uniref:Y-box-binding protein 1-like n=1 Tax=Phyllostomus discolor TaxID=89673 RepID=A0A6J2MEV0_9CHIR|nr:Y-box-binding protein 1-like [Phyllostomus discolor]
MERKHGLLSEAAEAGRWGVAVSVSRQAWLEDLLHLEGGDCPRAPVTSDAGRHRTLEAMAAAGTQGKAPEKVIAQRVSGSVKWYHVKCGYGFIIRHDTQEEVFVHCSDIVRSGPRKHWRSLGTREAVEFDVLQGERGTKAVNVTRPAGAPAKGCCFFNMYLGAPQPLCGTRGAKEDVVDGKAGRGDVPAAKGQTYCLTSNPYTQRQWRFPPFQEAPGATCSPATLAPVNDRWAVHLPAPAPAAGPEGAPGPPPQGCGLSYRLSRPRGRSTAPYRKPSPEVTQELEAEKIDSWSAAHRLQQGSPPRYGCHWPNYPWGCYRLQQPPDEQGQTPEGGEGEIWKGPAGKPACVAQKTSASEGEAAVARASSAAQAHYQLGCLPGTPSPRKAAHQQDPRYPMSLAT